MSATFDVVNVDLLLVRLKKMGLPTDVINLLESWLRDRQCYVEVRNCCSQYFGSDVGTVKGSILGPILFSLFLSPLLEKEDLISYADDNYLIKSNKCKEIALQRLQFQIQKVEKWLTSSGLKVNVEKTRDSYLSQNRHINLQHQNEWNQNTHQEANNSTRSDI
jgi:hypothetical protein